MSKPDLVFLTRQNEAQIKAQAETFGASLPIEAAALWECECGVKNLTAVEVCVECGMARPKPREASPHVKPDKAS